MGGCASSCGLERGCGWQDGTTSSHPKRVDTTCAAVCSRKRLRSTSSPRTQTWIGMHSAPCAETMQLDPWPASCGEPPVLTGDRKEPLHPVLLSFLERVPQQRDHRRSEERLCRWCCRPRLTFNERGKCEIHAFKHKLIQERRHAITVRRCDERRVHARHATEACARQRWRGGCTCQSRLHRWTCIMHQALSKLWKTYFAVRFFCTFTSQPHTRPHNQCHLAFCESRRAWGSAGST